MGTNRAAVIRLCVTGFLDHVEASGGVICLPSNWGEILKQLDGRSFRKSLRITDSSEAPGLKAPKAAEATKSPYSAPAKVKKAQNKKRGTAQQDGTGKKKSQPKAKSPARKNQAKKKTK